MSIRTLTGEEDLNEFKKGEKFRLVGCGYKRIYAGKPCCEKICNYILEAARLTMQELDKSQMDLCIMAEMLSNDIIRYCETWY